MYVRPNGEMAYLWRAVDQEGEILESYVTRTRDKAATLTFMKKVLIDYAQIYSEPRLALLYPHRPGLRDDDFIHVRHRITRHDSILETASIDVANGKNVLERIRRQLLADLPGQAAVSELI